MGKEVNIRRRLISAAAIFAYCTFIYYFYICRMLLIALFNSSKEYSDKFRIFLKSLYNFFIFNVIKTGICIII